MIFEGKDPWFRLTNCQGKDPWLRLTNCQTYPFSFLSSRPSFFFFFIKSIKIGSFSRFGYFKIRKDRDPCGEEVLHHIAAQQVPGLVFDDDHCVADVINEADWGAMIACHMKMKYIYTYAGQ